MSAITTAPTTVVAIGHVGGRHTYAIRPVGPCRYQLVIRRHAAQVTVPGPYEVHLCVLTARDEEEAAVEAARHIHDPQVQFLSDAAGLVNRDPAAWERCV